MIERACKEGNIDLAGSFVVGDKSADIMMGEKAGVPTILVQTGKAGTDGEYDAKPEFVAKDLLDASNWILEKKRNR